VKKGLVTLLSQRELNFASGFGWLVKGRRYRDCCFIFSKWVSLLIDLIFSFQIQKMIFISLKIT